jgi:hypothetical protein
MKRTDAGDQGSGSPHKAAEPRSSRGPATTLPDTSTPYVLPRAACAYLNDAVTERTLAQWRWMGIGPRFVKVGNRVLYRYSWIDTWLEEQSRTSTSESSSSA